MLASSTIVAKTTEQKNTNNEFENFFEFEGTLITQKYILELRSLGLGAVQFQSQQQSSQKTERQIYKFLGIYINQPLTAIGHALNSISYQELLEQKGFVQTVEEALITHKELNQAAYISFLNSQLSNLGSSQTFGQAEQDQLQQKTNSNVQRLVITEQVIKPMFKLENWQDIAISIRKQSNLSNLLQKEGKVHNSQIHAVIRTPGEVLEQLQEQLNDSSHLTRIKIVIWFPEQFEALRQLHKIQLKQFINSMVLSSEWKGVSGGKSQANFLISADNLFVIKSVEKQEVVQFESIAFKYFQYMCNNRTQTLISKIFGLYEVKISSSQIQYFIVMENLKMGVEGNNLCMYDLKGSQSNRFIKGKSVGLDTNFRVDFNGEPLLLKQKKLVEEALTADTQFLATLGRIDYSLLLLVESNKNKQTLSDLSFKSQQIPVNVRMGIIDYLQNYNFIKMSENLIKTVSYQVTKGGAQPTIIKAEKYAARFMDAVNQYFV